MLSPYRKIVFLLVLLAGTVLASPSSRAAECTIKGLSWDKSKATIGESVILSVTSSGCQEQRLSFNIYETSLSVWRDTFIVEVQGSFNNLGTLGFTTYRFNAVDYATGGDQTGGEKMIFKPMINGKELDLKSPVMALAGPTIPAGSCQLGSAKWYNPTNNGPIVKTPLHMIVSGANCAGATVTFRIKENNSIGSNLNFNQSVTAQFDQRGSQLDKVWVVNPAGDSTVVGSYQFYFTAAAGNSSVTSDVILVPVGSEAGCVNCNGGFAPDVCECADGTESRRGPFGAFTGSCNNICVNHVGDARNDSTTGNKSGTAPIDFGPNTPGQAQKWEFKLTNPLKGNINSIGGLIQLLSSFLLELAIPLAVIVILWGGFLMLTSGGNPGRYQKGIEAVKWAALGFAVVTIGAGFVALVKSLLSVTK